MYSAVNDEYPVNEAVAPPTLMANWSPLRADSLPLYKLVELRAKARNLVDTIRFDEGPNGPSTPIR